MSIYHRTYIARIAPCSEDWRDAIYNGVDVVDRIGVDRGELLRESFAPEAWIATADPASVILSHNDNQIVGHVTSRTVSAGWHVAAFVLDHSRNLSAIALDRLRIGAPVSIGFRTLRHDKLLRDSGVKRHTLARLYELSILAADERPAFPGARITQILESKKPIVRQPAANVSARRAFNIADLDDPARYRLVKTGPGGMMFEEVSPEPIARHAAEGSEVILDNEPGAVLTRYFPAKITVR